MKTLSQVYPQPFSAKLHSRAEAALQGVYQDYFSNISYSDFQTQHLGHTSLVMKVVTLRFANAEVMNGLRECLLPRVKELYGPNDYLIHPIFYLRFSFPGIYYSEKQKAAFLDSQPHYDRSFGVDAYSFWSPLEDADEESGGLCSFAGDKVLEHFPRTAKNRYNYATYLDVASSVDPMLRESILVRPIQKGDAFTFDSYCLHGATKPKTKRRLSFDFRLAPSNHLAKSDAKIQKLFAEVNRSFDLCAANNMIYFGDYKGAGRVLRELGENNNKPELILLGDGLMIKDASPALLAPGSQAAWQDEYRWLLQSNASAAY